MLISSSTRYSELKPIEKYLKDKDKQSIKRLAEQCLGGMYDLTFGKFYACYCGDFSHIGVTDDPTVVQVYWRTRFEEFVDEYLNALKTYNVPQTAKEAAASAGLAKVEFFEGMLVFMQQWFGLHSYREAEEVTLGDLLIAKRAAYNDAMYRRKYAELQRKK